MPTKQHPKIQRQLAEKLQIELDLLTSKYLSSDVPALSFPLGEELHAITIAAEALGIAHERKKNLFRQPWRLFKYLENRHTKLTLTDFCDKLLRKIEAIPWGPRTRIGQVVKQHQEDGSIEVSKLKEIIRLLDQNEMPSINSLAWSDYYLTLKGVASDDYKAALGKSKTESDYQFAEKLAPHHAVLGWGAFADLWQQSRSWDQQYGRLTGFEECCAWLDSLVSDDVKQRLWARMQIHDALETRADFRKKEKKRSDKERKKRSRRKRAEKLL
jgi:hypothetical protein